MNSVDFAGVEPAGEVVERHLQDVLAHLLGVLGVVGQGLRVGDHDVNLVKIAGVLQAHALLQRADIVSHMQPAGRAVARQNNLFHRLSASFQRARGA